MFQLISYTDLDSSIQSYMSNQAPNTTIRLEYINNFLKELSTKYNIEVARRSVDVDITPDGEPIDIDTLITEGDVNKIEEIREISDNVPTNQYIPIGGDGFSNNYNAGRRLNQYVFYTENGKRYLRLNSAEHSDSEVVTYKVSYFTSHLGYNSETEEYMEEIENVVGCKILLPYNYKRLAVTGICRDLFLISLGKDGETPSAIAENRYKSQLESLGLTGEAKKIRTNVRRVKIHPMF